MIKRLRLSSWSRTFERQLATMKRLAAATRRLAKAQPKRLSGTPRPRVVESGTWLPGVAFGSGGARRFRLFRPTGVALVERLPLLVMLHGCGQDADSFAASTRMNRIASRARFLVLYPEQERIANAQNCWNWFDTDSGRAYAEAELILKSIDQVCTLYGADPARVAIAGLSAGASMAALLVTRHPARFRAVVMHSGVPPGTAHSALSAFSAMRGRRGTAALDATPLQMQAEWPPLLVIHGTADTVVSPDNGKAAAQAWADAGGAQAGAERSVRRGKRYPMAVTDFKHRGRTLATLVAVQGLGHAWSGGAASQPFSDAQGPDASRMAWAFALKQFKG